MRPRFKSGDRVIVRNDYPPGHIRTPAYLRGKRGVVLRDFGAWKNPELLAYGKPGLPKQTNYWIKFTMNEVWHGKGDYAANDSVIAEIYEHWLDLIEPAGSKTQGKRT